MKKLSELAIDLQGVGGFHFDEHASPKDDWASSWINAPTGRIAGGSDETLLNTIAERILGLPQDHRPDKGVPFNEPLKNAVRAVKGRCNLPHKLPF